MKFGIVALAAFSLALGSCTHTNRACCSSESEIYMSVPSTPKSGSVDDANVALYRIWIADARLRHPYADTEQRMFNTMMCLSGGRANLVDPAGPYVGIFQYSDNTWRGEWNDYHQFSIENPRVQIYATALAWQKNMQQRWRCYDQASVVKPTSWDVARPSTVAQRQVVIKPVVEVQPPLVAKPASIEKPAETSPATPGVAGKPVVIAEAPPKLETAPVSTPEQPRPVASNELTSGSLAQYKAWIAEARAKHPYADSEQRMYDVMMCESGGNAKIVNRAGPYSGLFQYATGTWNGGWNEYRSENVLDARAQIFATALAWQKKMQRQWGCYTHPR